MRNKVFQILWAVLLGLAVPGVIMAIAGNDSVQMQTNLPSTTAPFETTEPDETTGLWVLTQEQELLWMDMNDYLTGVILAEIPTSYEEQALRAQAVVARTYALKRQQENRHENGAVCTDSGCCQAYISVTEYLKGMGYPEDVAIAKQVSQDTSDLVITYNGELIEATYFHSSGGRTEDAVTVWGVAYPYLQAVESPGEENMEHYTNRVFYSKEDLEKCLDRSLPGAPGSWIGWTTYTTGGGVESVLFAGVLYNGIAFRDLLGLYSTAFSFEPEGDGLWITTLGKGHRVGMSQCGAQAMALAGNTFEQIIAYYYPGTRIDKIEHVG